MKKIFVSMFVLSFVISCNTLKYGEREHYHGNMSNHGHHHHHHHHHHNLDINEFKGEVFNFHNEKGFKHSHVLLILSEDGDEAFIRIDGHEYELELEKSASGSLYVSDDKKISFHIKDKKASLEMNNEIINYFLLKSKNRDYAKSHDHDH